MDLANAVEFFGGFITQVGLYCSHTKDKPHQTLVLKQVFVWLSSTIAKVTHISVQQVRLLSVLNERTSKLLKQKT